MIRVVTRLVVVVVVAFGGFVLLTNLLMPPFIDLVSPSISREEFNAVPPGLTVQQVKNRLDDGALVAEGSTELRYRANSYSSGFQFPTPDVNKATAQFLFNKGTPGGEPKLSSKAWIPDR